MRYPITLLGQQRRPIVSVMAESPSGILGTKGFFEHFDFHLWHRLAHFDVEQGRDA